MEASLVQPAQCGELETHLPGKGLLMIYTGDGKGKSTAAFGSIMRACGHGFRVALFQFIKGSWQTGEQFAFARFEDLLTYHVMGEGFTDQERGMAAAKRAWETALDLMQDASYQMVVLDELTFAIRYGYLSVEEVIAGLEKRRPGMHVIVTGRRAPPELIQAADLVTEAMSVKHHFEDQAIGGQKGVEF